VQLKTLTQYLYYADAYHALRKEVDDCAETVQAIGLTVDKRRYITLRTQTWPEPYRSKCRFDAWELVVVQLDPRTALWYIRLLPDRFPY
jgi:hypothetical protein